MSVSTLERILIALLKATNRDLEEVNVRLHTYALERDHHSDLEYCGRIRDKVAAVALSIAEAENLRG